MTSQSVNINGLAIENSNTFSNSDAFDGRSRFFLTYVLKNISLAKTEGQYGAEGFIYQELCTLPNFSDNYPVIGSWIIGQEAAGIGIREANTLITDNKSRFVPHLIE
jgi:glutathionylspermidine synthase